jgi:hypothetical protein
MTTGQLLHFEVKVKISVCPTNPAWEGWECKAQGRNLADTVQRAALKALTNFCGKHPNEVASSTAKLIHVPERHTVPCVEREVFLPAQGDSHYSIDLVTLVRFSEAMYDTYRRMVGESVFYRHQIYRYRVKEMENTAQALKEARAIIATLKKERRKDKAKIQELSEIIHEQNFLLQHNDQYMLELENHLEALLDFPPNATHKMCCNMPYLVGIDIIATKLFRGSWNAKGRVALGYCDVVHQVVAKVFCCNITRRRN